MKAFITKSSGVNMDHPYFFGIMFRHVAKTEQPCRDVVQVRIGLIWWHIGITLTSGICTSNAAGQGREAYPAPPCSDIEIVRRNADKLLVNVTGTGMAFADWLDSIGIRATRVRIMSHGIERA